MKTWLNKLFGKEQSPAPAESKKAASPQASAERTIPANAEQTLPASVSIDPQALQAAEALVAAEWKVGDVILDLYEVKHIYEGGGMGLVYRVHHCGWNLDLAVKSPRPEFFQSQTQKDNFIRECETWINLGLHPHVVSCHYVRTLGGVPRVFAEYVEGGTLKEWIDSRKLYEGGPQKALKRILDISIQMAWGLDYAHEQGLIHQDVKPANVLMMPDGTAKITDFGLAKARAVAGENVGSGKQESILVSSGGMTPAYCSPEQANKRPLSRKTDIWSWAVSVLEMFTGDVCWQSGVAAPAVLKHLKEVQAEGVEIPDLPSDLLKLLDQCFSSESNERLASFRVAADQLIDIYNAIAGDDYPRDLPEAAELQAGLLNNQGVSRLDLGREVEAERSFDQALEIEPGHLEAAYNWGLHLWRTARATDYTLVKSLEILQQSKPSDPTIPFLLGWVNLERMDISGALAAFSKAELIGSSETIRSGLSQAKQLEANAQKGPAVVGKHTNSVESIALSVDNRLALAVGYSQMQLWDIKSSKTIQTFEAQELFLKTATLSIDGRWALTGGDSREVRLWETSTGKCLRVFEGHTSSVRSVALSANAKRALSASADHTLRLWDTSNGKCLRSMEVPESRVEAVDFCSDGNRAISGCANRELRLWDLSNGKCLKVLKGHDSSITSLAVSRDGCSVITGSHDQTLRFWDLTSGKSLAVFYGHTGRVNSVALSSNGTVAISGSQDGTLRLWMTSGGKCLRTFEGHQRSVTSVALSDNGKWALSGDSDGKIILWNLEMLLDDTKKPKTPYAVCKIATSMEAVVAQRRFKTLLASANDALVSRDYRSAWAAVLEGRLLPGFEFSTKALDLANQISLRGKRTALCTGWCRKVYKADVESLNSIVLSSDGKWAVSPIEDKRLAVWDVRSGKCLQELRGIEKRATSIALSGDEKWAISSSYSDEIRLWELNTGNCLRSFEATNSKVGSLSLSANGQLAVSGSCAFVEGNTQAVQLWQVDSGKCLRTFENQDSCVDSVAISPDGRFALCNGNDWRGDKPPGFWDLRTGNARKILNQAKANVYSVALSSDMRSAVLGLHNRIELWDLHSGDLTRVFEGHTKSVNALTLSADGDYLVSASSDHSIKIWKLSTGKCLLTLSGHDNNVKAVSLSENGRWILSAGMDNTLRLWELDWECDFPDLVDWHQGAERYLQYFLTSRCLTNGIGHTPMEKPVWTEEDFQKLIVSLQYRSFGWLRPEGVRRKLEKMTAEWQGPARFPWE